MPSGVQGHSAAVKEAVGASLLGCKAPFRLVQDHSRSGRLESSTLGLRKWLFSKQFKQYLSFVQVSLIAAACAACHGCNISHEPEPSHVNP